MAGRWIDPEEESNQSRLRARLESEYLVPLIKALNVLDVGSPSELVMSKVQNVPTSPIVGVWTPPRVRTVPSIKADKDWLRQGGIERRFESIFENLEEPLRVLLGDPGYGKTTAAKYLAILFADKLIEGNTNYVPIYVPLRYVIYERENVVEDVIFAAVHHAGCDSSSDLLFQAMASRSLNPFLILDGLDERLQGHAKVYPAVDLVDKLKNAFPNSVVLATSRVFDYLYDPENRLSQGSHYLLTEFSVPQIESTIGSWHAEAAKLAAAIGHSGGSYEARGESLIEFVRSDTEVQALVQTPLLLNLVQVLNRPDESLPRSIPSICKKAIKYLFIDRPLLRSKIISTSKSADSTVRELSREEFEKFCWIILQQLAQLAYEKGERGEIKVILWSELTQIIEKSLGADTPEGFQEKGSLLYPIKKHFIAGHGVLTDINKEAFIFVHNLFQDVLAGMQFELLSDVERLRLASSIRWQPAIRCWASLAAEERQTRADAILFSDQLFRRWQIETSTSSLLFNAAVISIEVKRRSDGKSSHSLNEDLSRNISKALLVALNDEHHEFEDRVVIGDLLGGIGDPRVPSSIEEMTQFESWHIPLPSGCFMIGRDKPHSSSSSKYDEVVCSPSLEIEFPQMSIGRFPVTNSEYRLFLSNAGYKNLNYWRTPEANKWVRSDEQFIQYLRNYVMASSLKHFETELRAGRLFREEIEDLVERMLKRSEPLYWRDQRFNKPNQPVVGVNWWEAEAYCCWLEEILRTRRLDISYISVDLPTEFEWERSGRPIDDCRPYPWGSGIPEGYGFVSENQQELARTVPIGLYPVATWDNGPLDLVGTVWNWTRSPKSSYLDSSGQEPQSSDILNERMVRGGSWLSRERESRCLTFRSFDPPCNAYEDLGFRVALYF